MFSVFMWLDSGTLPGENFVFDLIWFWLLVKKEKKISYGSDAVFLSLAGKNMFIHLISTNKQETDEVNKNQYTDPKYFTTVYFQLKNDWCQLDADLSWWVSWNPPCQINHLPWNSLKIQPHALTHLSLKSLHSLHSLEFFLYI